MTIATSRALVATEAATPWEEGLAPPAAAAGSGQLRLELGVGRLPAVQAVARALSRLPDRCSECYNLAPQPPTEALALPLAPTLTCTLLHIRTHTFTASPHPSPPRYREDYAIDLLAALAPAAMLAPYGLPPPTGTDLTALAARLQLLTTAGSGLLYSRTAARYASGVSLQLNAFALLIVRRLRLAGVTLPATLTALRVTWSAALETGLMASVDSARAYATQRGGGGGEAEAAWRDYETLALCRLALGRGWSPSSFSYPELTMSTLDAHATTLSTTGQAAYVMAQLYPATAAADDDAGWQPAWNYRVHDRMLRPLLAGFIARLRVTARTAYVASVGGGAGTAGARDNALVLAALATAKRAGAPAALATNLDKLANYVARGGDAVGVGSVRAVPLASRLASPHSRLNPRLNPRALARLTPHLSSPRPLTPLTPLAPPHIPSHPRAPYRCTPASPSPTTMLPPTARPTPPSPSRSRCARSRSRSSQPCSRAARRHRRPSRCLWTHCACRGPRRRR